MPEAPLFGRGILLRWDDARGFGFIAPQEGGPEVFLHISALGESTVRPTPGDLVTYRRVLDAQQRPRALRARLENPSGQFAAPLSRPRFSKKSSPAARRARLTAAGFLALLTAAAWFGSLPPWVPVLYTLLSAVTFAAYAFDKSRALSHERRLPESTLHLLAALGGWPGALVAQHTLPHKNAKPTFQLTFWLVTGVHLAFWAWCLWKMWR